MVKETPYMQIIVQVVEGLKEHYGVDLPKILRKNVIKEISGKIFNLFLLDDPMYRLEVMAKKDYILPEDAKIEVNDLKKYQKIMKNSL